MGAVPPRAGSRQLAAGAYGDAAAAESGSRLPLLRVLGCGGGGADAERPMSWPRPPLARAADKPPPRTAALSASAAAASAAGTAVAAITSEASS